MVKQAVKVVIRTRPTANFASKNVAINEDKGVGSTHLDGDGKHPEKCGPRRRQ